MAAPERMAKVDGVLGGARLERFATVISRLLAHGNPDEKGLSAGLYHHDQAVAANVFTLLADAACELETAWNVLRLGNISAAYRQARVAFEFIMIGALAGLPRTVLTAYPRKDHPLRGLLKKHPAKTLLDLWKPRLPDGRDESVPIRPLLDANQLAPPFFWAMRQVVRLDETLVGRLQEYRALVLHPASHGSAQVRGYHLDGSDGRVVGIHYRDRCDELYRQTADDLVGFVEALCRALDATHVYCDRPAGGPCVEGIVGRPRALP